MLHLGDNYKVVGPSCFMLMQYVVARMESKVMVVEYTGGGVHWRVGWKGSCLSGLLPATKSEVTELWMGFRVERGG